jgi:hypothetical protein
MDSVQHNVRVIHFNIILQSKLRTELFPGLNTSCPKYQMGLVITQSWLSVTLKYLSDFCCPLILGSCGYGVEKGRPFSWGLKRLGREPDRSPPSVTKVPAIPHTVSWSNARLNKGTVLLRVAQETRLLTS